MFYPQVQGLYPWPYDGPFRGDATALVVIDAQRDYLDPTGWLARVGGDVGPLRAVVPAIVAALGAARAAGLAVLFTVEAHRSDLSDLPANKLWRGRRLGAAAGDAGALGRFLVRGEPGAAVIDALAPGAGEPVVAKPGASAFVGTDLDHLLRRRGVRNLVLAGVTTDGAVQCTLRDANDRGYECLLLSDATASDVPAHHGEQLHTLSLAGGHYGSIAPVAAWLAALAVPGARDRADVPDASGGTGTGSRETQESHGSKGGPSE